MRRTGVAVLALALAATPAAGQALPGEEPPVTAFPTALSGWVAVGWGGQRALRTYPCGTSTCQTEHALTGAAGLGVRFQAPLTRRVGLRVGLSVASPKRRIEIVGLNETLIEPEKISALRGEALVLLRLKPRVPVFFGFGGALVRFSPGPVSDQPDATEVGGALVVGVDRQVSPRVATRFEWTTYVLNPTTLGLSSEYRASRLVVDHQLSFGVAYFVAPRR